MKKYIWVLVICALASFPLSAQEKEMKSKKLEITPALEKELFEVEKTWMNGEHEKNMPLLENLWEDQFFDDLTGGTIVTKHEMMDRLSKGTVVPGTGAFPDDFKIRAIYGNVVLATDHTVIKSKDPKTGDIVVSREMRCLRMFVRDNGKWKVAGAGLVAITPPNN